MKIQMTIEVPDIVGGVLLGELPKADRTLVCPDTLHPGFMVAVVDVKEVLF